MSGFDTERLSAELKPFRLLYFPELPSTNDKAIQLRREGALFAPAIVLTARQTAGRGRGGNHWYSDAGGLTVTFVLPVEEHLKVHQLPLVAGLAVRNMAGELTGDARICLKWPNDVMHGGRKLSGLLCERVNQADVIGIGINVNGEAGGGGSGGAELRRAATSLAKIAGREFDLSAVLVLLKEHLQRTLQARNSRAFAAFVEEYRQHDGLLGREVVASLPGREPALRGICEGIDIEGRLLLRTGRKLQTIISGSIAESG